MNDVISKPASPVEELAASGLKNLGHVHWDPPTPALYEEALRRSEGLLSHLGPLVVHTGKHTGRLPLDKFFVREPSSENKIAWGKINRPLEHNQFEALESRLCSYFQGKDVFVENCHAGADENHRLPIRVISERASGALFARTMFLHEPNAQKSSGQAPEFTILHAPNFHADPKIDGTHSEAFVVIHFGKKLILIGGTAYAGEIKKAVFTVMNYWLPAKGVLPMHCAANYGESSEDVTLFFGLSGTGKTTLSADPQRTLIGDDEHGWSDEGVFNFEGGCYAKVIKLSAENEPEIYGATRRFGTLLENVAIDTHNRHVDLNDASFTENTRAAYPITHIPNMTRTGRGGQPKHVIMLTCDAFGVLPPVSRLTTEQAVCHFLAGYTAKVAGTEAGVAEPQATFSPCFGAPFMALPPATYAKLFGEKIARNAVDVWLVNTGWSGGAYGEGRRIDLRFTRAMVGAILSGQLKRANMRVDPIFGMLVPLACPYVPEAMLNPRNTWKDTLAYDRKAFELAALFEKHVAENAGDLLEEMFGAKTSNQEQVAFIKELMANARPQNKETPAFETL